MSSASGWISPAGRILLLLGLCLSNLSCGGELAGRGGSGLAPVFEAYLTRLGRVVDREPPPIVAASLPAYPDRRALLVPVAASSIDVADFVELHRCDLGGLVGYRNSPLGRVQMASQRLGYEAEWLAALSRCSEPAGWMSELAREKTAQLPALFWNATFAADEMRSALGGAGADATADLGYLLRALSDSFDALRAGRFDQVAFEATLARLRSGSWVGPARNRWALWRGHLDAAGELLDGAGPRLCLNGRPTPRSRRLVNVFHRYYVGELQPELSAALRRQEVWVRQLLALVTALSEVLPDAFARWYAGTLDPTVSASEWSRTRRAILAHARAWQRVYESCGIEPGARVGED